MELDFQEALEELDVPLHGHFQVEPLLEREDCQRS